MARRRSRNSQGSNADTHDIANVDTLFELTPEETFRRRDTIVSRLDEFVGPELPYDRREFRFGTEEPYSLTIGGRTNSVRGPLPHTVGFSDPDTVAICVRRKVRKQVMIAKRRKGGGSKRFHWYSKVRC